MELLGNSASQGLMNELLGMGVGESGGSGRHIGLCPMLVHGL